MELSIVVPVYNVEQYIDRCIQSIVNQTKSDIEIILVDDGSTDNSGHLCDEYSKLDSRIRVIHKENGGLTSAWKAGVINATGKYIGFVDSDDWVDADMFETMYSAAISNDAQMVIAGLVYDFESGKGEKRCESSKLKNGVYNRERIEKEIYPNLLNDGSFFGRTIQPARVTKLYTKEIIMKNIDLCSETVSIGEDLQLTFAVLCDTEKVVMLENYFPYHYWINDKSMTGKHDPNYVGKIAETMNQLLNISVQKSVYNFETQIINDFLCLSVLGIKSEIMKNKGFFNIRRNLKRIFNMPEIRENLKKYNMPNLNISEKVYILLIKMKMYTITYLITKIFFGLKNITENR